MENPVALQDTGGDHQHLLGAVFLCGSLSCVSMMLHLSPSCFFKKHDGASSKLISV